MMARTLLHFLGSFLVLLLAGPADALQWDFQSTTTGDLPLPNGGTQQTACLVGDLDGDGVDDFIIAERKAAPSVLAYFLRPEGWVREVIDPDIRTVEAGGLLFDLDDDGDLDLLLGGDNSTNEIWWWENPGAPPYTTGWTRRLVKNTGSAHHHDQVIGDFDGDGDLEMAFWNQYAGNRLQLAEIPADPRATEPWPFTEIFQAAGPAEGLDLADINLDGKTDIVGAGYWFEHVAGTTYTPHLFGADRLYTRTAVAQLVPGGRPEIVTSPGDAVGPLIWYQWVDGVWQANELDPLVLHGHSLSLGDVDNNGLLDFLVAEMHTPGGGDQARMRIFLNQGEGVFTPETVNVGLGNHESKLGDFNDDGLLDLVGKPFKAGSPQINVWLQVPEVVAAVPSSGRRLLSVTPNPFNARVALRLTSDRRQEVEVAVFDLRGRRVATLADGKFIESGETTFIWDGAADSGAPSASGTYFFRARGDRWTEVAKVTLAK